MLFRMLRIPRAELILTRVRKRFTWHSLLAQSCVWMVLLRALLANTRCRHTRAHGSRSLSAGSAPQCERAM